MSHILIVDDNEADRENIRRIVNDIYHSIHITIKNTAEAGFAYIQNSQRFVDLIISDYNLPGMTGLELCERLRKVDNRIPLILTTGNGDESIAVQALRSGVNEYIIKSNDRNFRSQLIRAIPTLLKKWETEQKLERELLELREENQRLAVENRTLSKFTNSVSHHLYTQLSQLAGFSDLLSHQQSLQPASQQRYLDQIQIIARESIHTIDSLLNRSVETKDITLETCHMQVILNSALNRLAAKIRDQDVKVVIPKQLPDALGRPDWLETAWINLIDFALENILPGSRLTIGFTPTENKGYRFYLRGNWGSCAQTLTSGPVQQSLSAFLEAQDQEAGEIEVGLGVVDRVINLLQGSAGFEFYSPNDAELYFEIRQPQPVVQRMSAPRTRPRLANLTHPRNRLKETGKPPTSIIERFELLFSRNHA